MRPLAVALLGAIALAHGTAAQAQALNTLTRREKREGWKLLFDGHTTRGWRGYRRPDMPAGWQVRDGALTRVGSAGDIVTTSKYESFDLVFDWRIAHGGNSGLMYHVTEDVPEPYGSGPEYQLLDDPNYPDGRSLLTSAGACYGLYAIPEHLAKPAGQWNHSRLLVQHGRVDHWLNGVLVARYAIGSKDWNDRVAASKFKTWPAFGKADSGFIDLQDHGSGVAFRNLKIKVLR